MDKNKYLKFCQIVKKKNFFWSEYLNYFDYIK